MKHRASWAEIQSLVGISRAYYRWKQSLKNQKVFFPNPNDLSTHGNRRAGPLSVFSRCSRWRL